MVSTSVLKTAALCWLRYGKRMPIVCTEVGRWYADVVGVSPKQAIEVEVKRSKADLRAEFRNKATKHYLYTNAKETSVHVPNYFYVLVPKVLGEDALKVVEDSSAKAGVLSYDPEIPPGSRHAVTVLRRPTRLREAPPAKVFVAMAMMRCSSEVCGLHQSFDSLKDNLMDKLDTIQAKTLGLVARGAGVLDFESGVNDIELRARELAHCVEGVDEDSWERLSPEEVEKWMVAAVKLLDASYVNAKGWIDAPPLF